MLYNKSTSSAGHKYDTACFVQEAPTSSEMQPGGYEVKTSVEGLPYCVFTATLQTYGCMNRMRRRYDMANVQQVVDSDERIKRLEEQNKWRGEWNHPNPEIRGQQMTDIRMTIPEPRKTSHFISNHKFVDNKMKATITTHPRTEDGRCVASEIIDLGAVPSFSVRVLGNMIPNASPNQANMRVTKFITADMVDFPSHYGADADIQARVMESYADVKFLKDLAQYCAEQDETMKVVCESFEITPDEIMGIHQGSIYVEQCDSSKLYIPLRGDIRREAADILMNRGIR